MAVAILTLRRGTSTPSLAQSELFFNTSTNTLNVGGTSGEITLVKLGSNTGDITLTGNLSINGGISGSTLDITGDAKIDGNVLIGGNIVLGTGSDDIITVNAPFTGSLIPQEDAQDDIGSPTKRFNELYVVSASIENISVPGSGILSSSNENFGDFSESVDSRLDNIQSFTASQEELNPTFATTGSNIFIGDQTISGSLDVGGTIKSQVYLNPKSLDGFTVPNGYNAMLVGPVDINGEITLEGDSNLLILEEITLPDGLLSSSVTDFDTFSASIDSKVDNLAFATTESNIFIGDQTITGSIFMSGSSIFDGDLNVLGSVTASFFTGSFIGTLPSQDGRLDNLELFTASQEELNPTFATTGSNTFIGNETIIGSLSLTGSIFANLKDHTPSTSGSTFTLTDTSTGLLVDPSGSSNIATLQLIDNGNTLSVATLFASSIQIGQTIYTNNIEIGHSDSVTTLSGIVNFNNDITSSASITASYFVGDGSGLVNVTAAGIDFYDITNKPTLVSGSEQIDVNDTQNFQTFSSSVDSRLDFIEEGFSSSVDSRLDNIETYSSSLKQAIDVSGQDLTIYGNLTVQGETTTLNTTELLIEDKVLSLASGSTTPAQADGAGLHISGADASILWEDLTSALVINQKVSSSVGFKGDGSELTGVTAAGIDFYDITNKPTLVSGSSQVTLSLDERYLEINGDSVVSGSSQIIITDTTGYTTFSSSLSDRLDSLELDSASQDTRISQLETKSGSQDNRISNLESFTSSQETKNSTLSTYTQSVDGKFDDLQTYTQSIDTKFGTLQTYTQSIEVYTQSIDSDLSNLHLYTQSNDTNVTELFGTSSQYQSFSQSIDSTIKNKIDLEGVVSSSSDSSTIDFTITNGVISGDVIGGVISGSDQVTASLDGLYEVSGSVAQLVGIHEVSGSLGSAAWYNVSSSIDDGNPQVLGNAGAIRAYIDANLGGDIQAVLAGEGLSGGGLSGSVTLSLDTASAHFSDGVNEVISPFSSSVSASIAALETSSGYINYVTNSIEQLTGIEVADFDNNVAVTFIGGTLKFIFGTPAVPSSIVASLSGFLVDRFNQVEDGYDVNASWNNGGYTLISASLYEGSTLLEQVGVGTSLSFTTTTSGSHTYTLEYTGSSPLDGTIYTNSTTTTGTISKSNPASPTLTPTPTVQLGASSNQIEQGATGSISFISSSADPSNGWDLVEVTTNVSTPYLVTGSATGSSSISITATADYESPIGDNIPDLTIQRTTTQTYTKIRSLRRGASTNTSFTEEELANLALWDTTLGGEIGTIAKGTTNPSGQSVTISWSGDKYHYIVFDSSRSNLSNITTSGFGVLGQFSVTTVGQYKVYKTNTLQAGGAGSSITYTLT